MTPQPAQSDQVDAVEAPGLVFMAAYGDNREVRGMFDTPAQAHAFVKRLDAAMRKDEIATPGGGLPGDHNGTRAALASQAPAEQPEQPDSFHQAQPSGCAATAQLSALRAFAQAVMDGWPDDAGVDGFDLQNLCVKHGLMKLKDPAPTQPCAEEGGCACAGYYGADEFAGGVQCYEKTALLTGVDNAVHPSNEKESSPPPKGEQQ